MDQRVIKDFLRRWASRRQSWAWIAAVVLAGVLAFYWDSHDTSKKSEREAENPEKASTFIPAGFVLVPIEVSNFDALDSILGKFGIVDLYEPTDDPKGRPRKVGAHLRILRAPLNPSRFAVLAREEDSPRLVSHQGPFIAVIQNSELRGTGIVNGEKDDPNSSSTTGARARGRSRNSRVTVEVFSGRET